jgi:hypothetical protein
VNADLQGQALQAVADARTGRPDVLRPWAVKLLRDRTGKAHDMRVYIAAVDWALEQALHDGTTTVTLNADQLGALRQLLDLVHYDPLAQSWRDRLPSVLFFDDEAREAPARIAHEYGKEG